MTRFYRAILRILRALADESAYRSYLHHHQLSHSPEQWRRFLDQRLKYKYAHGRCC